MTTVPMHDTKPAKRHRIFMWFFLVVQLLFAAWVIAGIASGSENTTDAENAGTAIGVGLLVLLWFFVDCFLGVGYAVYRLARRNV